MEDVKIIFLFNGEQIIMECNRNENVLNIFKQISAKINKEISNIYFLYNGDIINEDSKIDKYCEKKGNEAFGKEEELRILVSEFEENENDLMNLKKSKDIICPVCKEICLIKFNDYKITLYNCKNKHYFTNILFSEFDDFQKIDESKITCGNCNNTKSETHNNQFFKCYNCNYNLCPLCKSFHNKNHIIIDYDLNNYLCNKHNERYIIYSKENFENYCELCQIDINKNIFLYKINKNSFINIIELEKRINDLKNEIKGIENNKFNKIIDYLEEFLNLTKNIICNYDLKKKNYELLMNINNIYEYNEKIIKDINKIINELNIEKKLNYINEIYSKIIINNEITLKYKIDKEDKINIFGNQFVRNNKNNYRIIINNKDYELMSILNIKEIGLEIKNEIIEIKLKQIKTVTDLSYMFSDCKTLIEIKDISNWNTDNILYMKTMFSQCELLTTLPDISNWNTHNVIEMNNMFSKCKSLCSLPDISKWNTSNVKNISAIFQECVKISSLPDISKWNTNNVTDISYLFNKCSLLSSIPDISKWNTNNVTDMSFLFNECSSLSSIPDISNWNTNNVITIKAMFSDCSKISSLPDISNWNTSKIFKLEYK